MGNLLKSNWKKNDFHIGTVQVGSTTPISFERHPGGPQINRVVLSCNCINVKSTSDDHIIVHFKAQAVPKHLSSQGHYTVTKRVTVIYDDGEDDQLIFTAKVKK